MTSSSSGSSIESWDCSVTSSEDLEDLQNVAESNKLTQRSAKLKCAFFSHSLQVGIQVVQILLFLVLAGSVLLAGAQLVRLHAGRSLSDCIPHVDKGFLRYLCNHRQDCDLQIQTVSFDINFIGCQDFQRHRHNNRHQVSTSYVCNDTVKH